MNVLNELKKFYQLKLKRRCIVHLYYRMFTTVAKFGIIVDLATLINQRG